MHQLELLPGLGKKHMWEIIELRRDKEFESFADLKARVKLMPDPENAIVTESQFLKGLVELGIPGFLLLAFLWFQIGTTSLLAFQRTKDAKVQAILLGVVISLLIVFIEGLVYQNLEVKQVNAYFWTIVGILAVIYRSAG